MNGVKAALPGLTVSSRAVDYAASFDQASAGPGATDMTRQVVALAAECPGTSFVLGGYSQGASVTDIAIGGSGVLGRGESIPADLEPRVKAVVVFGNPLRLRGSSIARIAPAYADKALDICATGDPVCGGGSNFLAHLSYRADGSITRAARFAADRVGDGAAGGDGAVGAAGGATSGAGQASESRVGWGWFRGLLGR